MQAINHAATALMIKRLAPEAPLLGLIIASEGIEFLWVALNLIGIEETRLPEGFSSVSDLHLVHMPWSHSVLMPAIYALCIFLLIRGRGGPQSFTVALAMAAAIFGHILADLLVHAPDIAFAPFMETPKFGTGLYAEFPLAALGVETVWGVLCWFVFRGSWTLLAVILVLNAGSITFYSAALNAGEAAFGGQPAAFAVMIFAQILLSSFLVWFFARDDRRADSEASTAQLGATP